MMMRSDPLHKGASRLQRYRGAKLSPTTPPPKLPPPPPPPKQPHNNNPQETEDGTTRRENRFNGETLRRFPQQQQTASKHTQPKPKSSPSVARSDSSVDSFQHDCANRILSSLIQSPIQETTKKDSSDHHHHTRLPAARRSNKTVVPPRAPRSRPTSATTDEASLALSSGHLSSSRVRKLLVLLEQEHFERCPKDTIAVTQTVSSDQRSQPQHHPASSVPPHRPASTAAEVPHEHVLTALWSQDEEEEVEQQKRARKRNQHGPGSSRRLPPSPHPVPPRPPTGLLSSSSSSPPPAVASLLSSSSASSTSSSASSSSVVNPSPQSIVVSFSKAEMENCQNDSLSEFQSSKASMSVEELLEPPNDSSAPKQDATMVQQDSSLALVPWNAGHDSRRKTQHTKQGNHDDKAPTDDKSAYITTTGRHENDTGSLTLWNHWLQGSSKSSGNGNREGTLAISGRNASDTSAWRRRRPHSTLGKVDDDKDDEDGSLVVLFQSFLDCSSMGETTTSMCTPSPANNTSAVSHQTRTTTNETNHYNTKERGRTRRS